MVSLWLRSSILLLLGSYAEQCEGASSKKDHHLESVKEIFAWVNAAEDGFVSPKQSVSRMVEGDQDTPLIVIAMDDIKEGELLVQTPWSHILHSETPDFDFDAEWYCGTAHTLAKEMKKGSDSFYAPYVNYINDEADNQLPSQYSPKAKKLLEQVIGFHPDEMNRNPYFDRFDPFVTEGGIDQRISPAWVHRSLEVNWFDSCQADPSDTVALKAASMVMQRADDHILIPAYDAYNHRNNDIHNGVEYMNARTLTTVDKYHQTFALRDIRKGEQIFISYNMCEQCQGRAWGAFGTAEMFREYGFVEWFPQRWWYPGFGDFLVDENDLAIAQFDLFQEETTKNLTIVWTHETVVPQKRVLFQQFLNGEIRRLLRLKNIEWADMYDTWTEEDWKASEITAYEWNNINQFVDANIVAMTLAVEDISRRIDGGGDKPLTVNPDELKVLLGDGSHYDSLEDSEMEDLGYDKTTCDNREAFQFRGFVDTEQGIRTDAEQTISFFESHYFNLHVDDVDVCMDIDNVLQVCSSQRPYLYEYMVHLALRYLPIPKRVAIVGGGNSMLLNEVLKYSEIEKVVSFELDQTVTRKASKHFKVDPRFDDQRVDWWFGDIVKSLKVLPESYWGSFDLVLVDLSNDVLDRKISDFTTFMDVAETLSLLVNPDAGILVQTDSDDDYFHTFYDYFVELHHDLTLFCSRSLMMGSYGIDFFHAPIYDHGIAQMKNILYTAQWGESDNRHNLLHVYGSARKCEDKTRNAPDELYGVLEIVTIPNSVESFESTDISVPEGFSVVAKEVRHQDNYSVKITVLKEGYVIARMQELDDDDSNGYIGFDIHLWSKIGQIEELKFHLRKVFGVDDEGQEESSHKVVVGGMHGTAVEDLPVQPGVTVQQCKEKDSSIAKKEREGSQNISVQSSIIVEETVSLTRSDSAVAAVFCGSKQETCVSAVALQKHSSVQKVVEFHECDGTSTEELYVCEQNVIRVLKEQPELNLLVLDSTASQTLYQMVNSIFSTHSNREDFLADHSVAVALPSTSANSPWIKEFLDRYRKQIHHEPVKSAIFSIESDSSKVLEFGVVSTNDIAALHLLDIFEKAVQRRFTKKAADLKVQLVQVNGGLYTYTPKLQMKSYSQRDYDTTQFEKDFASQIPFALQTIYQFEVDPKSTKVALSSETLPKIIYEAALSKADGLFDPSGITFHSVDKFNFSVADGSVCGLFADDFHIVAVWDGLDHVDVNFVFMGDKLSSDLSVGVEKRIKAFSGLQDIIYDSQPRGVGKLIGLPEDLPSTAMNRSALKRGNDEL